MDKLAPTSANSKKRAIPVIIPFLLVVFVGGGLLLAYLSTMQSRMQDEAMLAKARVYSEVLSSTQAFYASEVLPHADMDRITVTHDYKSTDHALPYPATLTIDFADYLSQNGTNFSAAMLSDYPFSWRSERALSEFDRRALDAVETDNSDEYFEFKRGDATEKDHLNYASTIRMKESCVACHNSHSDSPKNDWEIGDARGIHVIALPVNTLVSGMTREFGYLIAIMGLATLLTATAITMVRQRETRALQSLETRNIELLKANIEKDQANSAKGEFLANISHEIRTPINGILGLAELMILDNPRSDERERLKRIRGAGTSLLQVINDVLDFSKIEANKIDIEVIPYEIEKIVEYVVGVFVLDQKKKDRPKLFIDIDPRMPARLLGDPHRISQIITNLLSNAFKFTETGHIILSVRCDEGAADTIKFAVTDTGPGIEVSALNALFKPFTQVDGTVTRRFGGTGLGLAISFDLAQRMSGALDVETKLGMGSTFTLSLPFKPASADEPSILAEREDGLSVIHIFDTENVRYNIFKTFFNDLGITAKSVVSAKDAEVVLRGIQSDGATAKEILLVNLDGNVAQEVFRFCTANQTEQMIVLYPPDDASSEHEKPKLQRPLLPTALMRHIEEKLGEVLQSAPEVSPEISEPALPLKGLTVLAVDDNELNRVVIKAFLERGGAIADLASSGEEAVNAVCDKHFDVILMDIQMPDMDGYEAARQIRSFGKDMPIIALTANAFVQDKERSAQEGMAAHLSKPVSREELYTVLSPFVPADKA